VEGFDVFEIDWSGPASLVLVLVVLVVITGVVGAFLLVKLVMKHRQVNRPDTPFSAKFVYYASLVYAIFPIDLLPDPALIDDIGVLAGALFYVSRVIKKLRGRPEHPLADVPRSGQARLPRGS
jgi:uncharacterized membrane protein YkvA (DUF1232 family)